MLRRKLGLLSILLVLGTVKCTAQRFCSHLGQAKSQSLNTANADLRTDTFDILKYWINADFRGFTSDQQMEAICVLQIHCLESTDKLRLDLLGLDVNYCVQDHLDTLGFTHEDESLLIDLNTVTSGDTFLIEVSYRGKPKRDSRWGGFYFSGDYAFNLGVGFDADPHNYGRVWFPCFDNFTDRALYSFNISVDSGFMALCNGSLTGEIDLGSWTTYHWDLRDPIPTYLASVAIAPYALVQYEASGEAVILASLPKDTVNMKNSFEHLPECIQGFKKSYGHHRFERVGFNMVPFNGGAMEHATNIAYPLFGIQNGSKQYETLFAHELAHHWWGDNVTCSSQEDMWIN